MGLLVRLLQLVVGFALRLGVIVVALFAMHLVLTRWWPELRRTASLIDEQPALDERVRRAEGELRRAEQQAELLEQQLEQRSKQELRALRDEVEGVRQQVAALEKHKTRALQELEESRSVVSEYCDTYNPIKLWFCRDMRARTEKLEEELSQVVSSLEADAARARGRIRTLEDQLDAVARDPEVRMRILNQRAPEETKRLVKAIADADARSQRVSHELEALEERQQEARAARDSTLGWLLREWRTAWEQLVLVALVVVLLPFLQRTLWYFAMMPLVSRARPIELASDSSEGCLEVGEAARSLRVRLEPGEVLFSRPSYARPIEGAASSKLLYRYRAPFISYAAGLVMLTRLRGKPDAATSATLSAPDDPNSYLMRLDLKQHPGVVIRPKHLVGIVGELELETRWRPFSLHAWSTWQLRYILLRGTGSLIVEGVGDVVAEALNESRSKIEQKLVLGFDSRLSYRTSRTETFLPYLFGKAPLVDDVFEKTGTYFWQKSSKAPATNPVERAFDALFSALGKLLGF